MELISTSGGKLVICRSLWGTAPFLYNNMSFTIEKRQCELQETDTADKRLGFEQGVHALTLPSVPKLLSQFLVGCVQGHHPDRHRYHKIPTRQEYGILMYPLVRLFDPLPTDRSSTR